MKERKVHEGATSFFNGYQFFSWCDVFGNRSEKFKGLGKQKVEASWH